MSDSLNIKTGDTDDLESLFDSILAANATSDLSEVAVNGTENVVKHIGNMARTLHTALRELGLSTEIEKMVSSSIPDARDRLNYVSTLTLQAAERVLNASEVAQPIVEKMGSDSSRLAKNWDRLFENKLDVVQFRNLVMQTQDFLSEMPNQTQATHVCLLEIMMAQDFQDLTGQVIKKIMDLLTGMEQQLVALLLENAPASARAGYEARRQIEPAIHAQSGAEVLATQSEVNDLLESLGF